MKKNITKKCVFMCVEKMKKNYYLEFVWKTQKKKLTENCLKRHLLFSQTKHKMYLKKSSAPKKKWNSTKFALKMASGFEASNFLQEATQKINLINSKLISKKMGIQRFIIINGRSKNNVCIWHHHLYAKASSSSSSLRQ